MKAILFCLALFLFFFFVVQRVSQTPFRILQSRRRGFPTLPVSSGVLSLDGLLTVAAVPWTGPTLRPLRSYEVDFWFALWAPRKTPRRSLFFSAAKPRGEKK